MGPARPDDPGRRRALTFPAPRPDAVPAFEWVFGCATALGGVAPGVRDSRFNGRPVRYVPVSELGSGARWCSSAWLERDLGTRGFRANRQAGTTRFAMHVSGQIRGGTVVVVPDDQVEAAAALAARLLTPRPGEDPVLREWSMAVVREPGRSRLAVRLGGGTEAPARFAAELDVEWLIDFGPGGATLDRTVAPDHCTVRTADGRVVAELGGTVYLEDEPVSARLVEIAERWGDALSGPRGSSGVITIPTGSLRPLEPDEWDIDRDSRRWIR